MNVDKNKHLAMDIGSNTEITIDFKTRFLLILARARRRHTGRAKASRELERILGQTRWRSTKRNEQAKRKSRLHSLSASDNQQVKGKRRKIKLRRRRLQQKVTGKITELVATAAAAFGDNLI